MRADLTQVGFDELTTAAEVDAALALPGTTMIVLNSVCGCAAGSMRPAVKLAIQHATRPQHLTTAFAGVDREAVDRARQYMLPYPPSSPCVALFKDGRLVHMVERHHIEGRSAAMIAEHLQAAFDEYCAN
jgi:putative YphP/YqiW family bacilliredoxin